MARLIADSRESTSGLIQLLTNRGAEVVLEELDCADYVLADGVAVERKTAEDFAGSIIDRRLFVQIALLKDTYEKVFIVVEVIHLIPSPPFLTRQLLARCHTSQ